MCRWHDVGITAIMTVYNRPYCLLEQYKAIISQTVTPEEIFIWINKGVKREEVCEQLDKILELSPEVRVIDCNYNWKFHGRFTLPLLARTEYVAMFDDDTIPGRKWFENCLESMETARGIMGTVGILLQGPSYSPFTRHGWPSQNEHITKVDLVGHAWFFAQEWAKYMWYEPPVMWDNGEDIMFSYLCQKHGGIKTFVPPHPKKDSEMWGSVKSRYGADDVANCIVAPNHGQERNQVVRSCCNHGWKLVCGR
jgi:hypothetical protein